METFVAVVGSIASLLGAFAAFLGIRATLAVAQMQKNLSQRQLIIPLWDHMTKLNDIDPEEPKVEHVLNAVHTLELVALCCEGGMVDEQVIKRTFREPFMKLYEVIGSCKEMPALGRNGAALLRENPAAMTFYEGLKREHMDRAGRPTPPPACRRRRCRSDRCGTPRGSSRRSRLRGHGPSTSGT